MAVDENLEGVHVAAGGEAREEYRVVGLLPVDEGAAEVGNDPGPWYGHSEIPMRVLAHSISTRVGRIGLGIFAKWDVAIGSRPCERPARFSLFHEGEPLGDIEPGVRILDRVGGGFLVGVEAGVDHAVEVGGPQAALLAAEE